MCKQHALRIAWTIARSIAFLDFRVLRWKFTYDWKCVNTTYRYRVPLFMPTACFPEGPSPPFTFCSFWRRRQRLEAVIMYLSKENITCPKEQISLYFLCLNNLSFSILKTGSFQIRTATFTHVNGTVSCSAINLYTIVYTNFGTWPESWFINSIS